MAVTRKHLSSTSDAAEMERLRLQARVWEPEAGVMLEQIGVRPGWRCADLGCGAMGVLGALARRVGMDGRVVGIDNDARLVKGAREYVKQEGLGNIDVVEADAFATQQQAASFDLTHARFLISHTGRDAALLGEMVRLTRPGGIVALEEPDASSWNSYPGSILWSSLRTEILAAFKRQGGDFDAGLRIRTLLQRAGLEDIQMRAAVLPIAGKHPYKRLPLQLAWSMRRAILDGGRVTEAQLDRAVAECERIAADPASTMMTFIVVQAWGRKPG